MLNVQDWAIAHPVLDVVPLTDPVIDKLGHRADSRYTEAFWLPVLGPSSLLCLRRLAALVELNGRATVPIDNLGPELGLGGGVGRTSPVVRTLARLVNFGMAEVQGDQYAVRIMVMPLAQRQVHRLPDHLNAAHRVYAQRHLAAS